MQVASGGHRSAQILVAVLEDSRSAVAWGPGFEGLHLPEAVEAVPGGDRDARTQAEWGLAWARVRFSDGNRDARTQAEDEFALANAVVFGVFGTLRGGVSKQRSRLVVEADHGIRKTYYPHFFSLLQ